MDGFTDINYLEICEEFLDLLYEKTSLFGKITSSIDRGESPPIPFRTLLLSLRTNGTVIIKEDTSNSPFKSLSIIPYY
ncbi:hypothetical protein K8353_47890, partial [Burkholderia contaminans]|nr:hypothetical protein [Burkholderia contaminans]